MRRPHPTLPISPKQLKHFAAATVGITCVAGAVCQRRGWGAQAQVEAIQAKNDLAALEAEKLGVQAKSRAKIKVDRPAASCGGSGDSSGGLEPGGGGCSIARRRRFRLGPSLPRASGHYDPTGAARRNARAAAQAGRTSDAELPVEQCPEREETDQGSARHGHQRTARQDRSSRQRSGSGRARR